MTNKVQKIKEWTSKEQDGLMDANGNFDYPEHEGSYNILCNLDAYIDSLQEEPVNEDLEEAARKIATRHSHITGDTYYANDAWFFKKGAQWQKEHPWKPADGEDLPELEREVVVLVDNFGKLIPKLAKRTYHLIENFVDEDTGEIISIEKTNEVGDVINWTEPAIYWLDINLPKLEED